MSSVKITSPKSIKGSVDPEWVEAIGKKPEKSIVVEDIEVADINPVNDPRYVAVTKKLRTWHGELLKEGFAENPALIGDYLGKLRLNVNLLFSFLNAYIDLLVDQNIEVANKRQNLYEEAIKLGRSENASKNSSGELTRKDEALTKTIEYRIQQIKNEYERYNGICIFLQSRMKEFNTERIMN